MKEILLLLDPYGPRRSILKNGAVTSLIFRNRWQRWKLPASASRTSASRYEITLAALRPRPNTLPKWKTGLWLSIGSNGSAVPRLWTSLISERTAVARFQRWRTTTELFANSA